MMLSGIMALSLVMTACGSAAEEEDGEVAEEEVVSADMPKYGGTISLVQVRDITVWDDIVTKTTTPGAVYGMTNEPLWAGDWALGNAGGYGKGVTDWATYYDRFEHKAGYLAESWEWTVDAANNMGTVVYQIRPGTSYALNAAPWAEAAQLVNGRDVTMDDIIYSLKANITDDRAYIYRANPELREAEITQTDTWEITINVPLPALYNTIGRFGNYGRVVPPEVVEKYGDMANWKTSVGSGPFVLSDHVEGSSATLVRNPDYWGTDPVGPGKGNQLPYLDGYTFLIIPDLSTRLAALRTGQLDQLSSISTEDAIQMRSTAPKLVEFERPGGGQPTISMRTDKPPYDDVRVRRALMMATDFEAVNDSFYEGRGQILTWPYAYSTTYADLYLGLDDPEMPDSVKELYVYNPEKAKELLAEAGYPEGFKTTALITASQVDYYSIVKDMWSKVGVEIDLDVKERGAWQVIMRKHEHEALAYYPQGPVSMFYTAIPLRGTSPSNAQMLDDPIINEALDRMLVTLASEGETAGMAIYKDLMKYVLDQAFVIPGASGFSSHFWWPWLKNYTGEFAVGFGFSNNWTPWVWVDQELKQTMGY